MANTDLHAKLKATPGATTFVVALLFGLTSLLAVWAAYDRPVAWLRFAGIAVGLTAALVVAWLGRQGGEGAVDDASALGWAGIACAVLAAGVGAYFLLTYRWSAAAAGQPGILLQAGLWVQSHRPGIPLREDVNANVAAGALVVLLPLGAAGLLWAATRAQRGVALAMSALLVLPLTVAAGALLLTGSRGAWIGLAAGGIAALCLVWGQRHPRRAAWLGPALLLGGGVLLAGLFWAAVTMAPLPGNGAPPVLPGLESVFGTAAGGRASLWRDMLALAGDYPFTGSGLGSTMMVYSTYVLLLHVGYITHAHNLFLQIATEQGLPALLLFLALLGVSLWGLLPRAGAGGTGLFDLTVFAPLAAAALVALVVHGMADAGLYVSRLAPVVFLPIGFALAVGGLRPGRSHFGSVPVAPMAVAMALVAALSVLALLPPVRAAMQTNLGAVSQTRAELARYEWPAWPIQDAVRRAASSDLAPAMLRYRAALILDPHNAAANRRLGQIELSLGQYDAARAHLEAAYRIAPGQRATRQLLGESYAVAGEIRKAADLWRTIDLSLNQLDLRVWWYNHLGERDHAASIQEAAGIAR